MKSPETATARIIISGGGTGGHLFPALAIAGALRKLEPSCEILFVGALGRIEMEKVPAAGFEIVGLDIRGFQRSFSIENLKFPYRVLKSLWRSFSILKTFKPAVAVGVGGYASGPLLFAARRAGVPCLIQEQNSYPGVTNRLLAKGSAKICVAYGGMEKFFQPSKILLTGNPVRESIAHASISRADACAALGLDPAKKILLVIGGSLGARTLNESILPALERLQIAGVQLLWQTGRFYYKEIRAALPGGLAGLHVMEFIDRMDAAYAASDLIISRAGAGTISELAFAGRPVILVPSPNVAEDHQTHNARALVDTHSAILITDAQARFRLVDEALGLLADPERCRALGENIRKQAFEDAAGRIAAEVLKLAVKKPKA